MVIWIVETFKFKRSRRPPYRRKWRLRGMLWFRNEIDAQIYAMRVRLSSDFNYTRIKVKKNIYLY